MDTTPCSIIESCWWHYRVGLWNVLDDMRNGDYYFNYLYIMIGLIIWWFTGEFRLQFVVQPAIQQENSIEIGV